jgi:hypothetical protein
VYYPKFQVAGVSAGTASSPAITNPDLVNSLVFEGVYRGLKYAITNEDAGDKWVHASIRTGYNAASQLGPLVQAGLLFDDTSVAEATDAATAITNAFNNWGVGGRWTIREYRSFKWKNAAQVATRSASATIDKFYKHDNNGAGEGGECYYFTSEAGIQISGADNTSGSPGIQNALGTWAVLEAKVIISKPFGQAFVGHPWVLQGGVNTLALADSLDSNTNGGYLLGFGDSSVANSYSPDASLLPGAGEEGDGLTGLTIDFN